MTTNQTIDGVPLLPCPFCGDTPEITKHHREDIYGLMHRCPVAGAISWGFREDPTGHAKRWNRRALPAAQPQGEPVAWLNVATGQVTTCAVVVMDWDDEKEQVQSLYAEQTAPVAVVIPERSNQDYAIEHAEYMALSADDVLAKFQAYGLALLAVDEGGDDGEGELLENIDSARGDLQESLVDMRSMVYEFRKRSAKSR
ncbi:MAG: Lar family restriction alleviation protein [Pseudomonas sp.]